jgi:hypothetical protein
MNDDHKKPDWAPRVPPAKIKRLYELDARGILDDDLLLDVGYRLYSRCKSILTISRIWRDKQLPCPRCEAIVLIDADRTEIDFVLNCTMCGWTLPWKSYWATFRHQELGGGGAIPLFEAYIRVWEHARTPQARMIAIDRLIHQWHWETQQQRPRFGLGRPTGVNLIEGSRKQVLAFLDNLTYGEQSTTGVKDVHQQWQAKWAEVKARQQAKRPERSRKLHRAGPLSTQERSEVIYERES